VLAVQAWWSRLAGRKGTHKRRFVALLVGAGLAVLMLIARVVDVQAFAASRYASYANSELYQSVALPAARGAIYDRAGNLLAASVSRVDVVADDYLVRGRTAGAQSLARLLGLTAATLESDLHEHSGYVVLASEVDPALANKVAALNLSFITLVPVTDSVMPDGGLFSPLFSIGPTGQGASGLEEQYRGLLSGTPGSEQLAVGEGGTQLPSKARDVHPATQGDGLVLTLDQPLQYEVTNALSAQISATKAASGVAIVMDTHTGGILAMVNLQRSAGRVEQAGQNLALEAEYQPGSVMKLATVSGALQEGRIKASSVLTVPDQIYVGGSQFEDAELHPTERLPVTQILAQSSNVGTIEIAHRLGAGGLYHYLRDLGFGQPTGLNWPGETPGYVPKPGSSRWWGSSMGAIPIGTGEAVTPVQVLDAYNAVANGGMFVPPRLVQATVSPAGTERPAPYAAPHRVLDAATVRELVPMLEEVTAAGTATLAEIPGYKVAGKTGTAQIPSSTGGYITGAWMATFVGFVPAQQPRLTAIVVLDRPDVIYGGSASAPVFSTIMRYALRHFDISPPATSGASRSAGHP
jgi:cell division protein FtsI (penicillin-binding protein 3)